MRHKSAVLLLAVVTLALAATRASASPDAATTYSYTKGAAVYVSASTPLLPPDTSIDDSTYTLSTTSASPFRLPWPIKVYGRTFSSMVVSTNGNVQFGTTGSAAYSNDCLPTQGLPGIAVMPYWDDLKFDTSVQGTVREGIYVRAYTEAGLQKYVISWRGHQYASAEPVRAEVIFTRYSNNFEFRYAAGLGATTTIGVQRAGGASTSYACNKPNAVDAGVRIAFRYV